MNIKLKLENVMKRYNLHIIIIFILGLFLINGCQDEELVKKNNSNVIEGIPVTATLSFMSENRGEQVVTKGALPTVSEYKVNDLYVYVFKLENNQYVKELGQHFEGSDLVVETQKDDINNKETKGSVMLKVTSGEKKILAIANVGNENNYELSKRLAQVETLDDLTDLAATLASPEVPVDRSSGLFLMSGSFAAKESATAALTGGNATINEKGQFTTQGKIYLVHLDSRINFNVKVAVDGTANALGERTQSITFVPKGYRVVNVPVSSFLFERSFSGVEGSTHDKGGDSQEATAATGYEDTKGEGEYVNFDQLSFDEGEMKGGQFTFYMFENRKRALNSISDYAERERQAKDATGKNGEYINAHKYATYVEMVGSYAEKYTDASGESKEKTAEVKYTIHMGYVNGASDFSNERNTQYTYNVTVRGVDNIELEVTSSTDKETGVIEKQPGAEGEIVKSKQFYYVDAHYVVDRIVFNKDNVSDNASFRVKTPFDKDGRGDQAKDYEWVWFVKNQKKNVGGKVITYTYSGLNQSQSQSKTRGYSASAVTGLSMNYPDPYETSSFVEKSNIKKGSYYYASYKKEETSVSGKWEYPTSGYVAFPQATAQRINIKDLIKLLKEKKKELVSETSLYDSDGNAAFTVFIDEYYYYKDPTSTSSVHWSKFVNGDNREMHILCDTEYSQDAESSLTTSNFLISQKPIRTFYDASQQTGWGVEHVNEPVYSSAKNDGRLPINDASEITSDRSMSNGRYNMYKNIGYSGTSSWSTYIDPASNQLKKIEDRALLQQACLQRNRDLNGDGKITHNEVRWYLPAINQMTGLFLGKDALPLEVQLMKNGVTVTRPTDTSGNFREFHYTNSNNVQFWAEEGAATGSNGMNNGYWNYRCVRNLGVAYDSNTPPAMANETQDYAVRSSKTDGVLIDLTAVTANALRATDDKGSPLAITDELSEYNRPYKKFLVSNTLTTKAVSSEDIYDNKVVNPCPSGWRMPNMRELTLIRAYSGLTNNTNIYSQTMSSLTYKKSSEIVYTLNSKGEINLGGAGSAVVRCVKDVK